MRIGDGHLFLGDEDLGPVTYSVRDGDREGVISGNTAAIRKAFESAIAVRLVADQVGSIDIVVHDANAVRGLFRRAQ